MPLNESGPGAVISISGVPDELVEALDEWWEKKGFDSRSEALRFIIRKTVKGSIESNTPLDPPLDDQLAHGYRRLCQAANSDGVIRDDTAQKVCCNGPQNLSKEEARALVLERLDRQNYINRLSDWHGNTAWKLVGVDE